MTLNERISLPLWQKIILIIVGFITVSIQIFLWVSIFDFLFNIQLTYSPIVFYVVEAIGLCFVLHILSCPISADYKLTWCVLILILPLPFCLLYSANKISKAIASKKQKKIQNFFRSLPVTDNTQDIMQNDVVGYNLIRSVQSSVYAPVYSDTKFTFFADARQKHKDMIEQIQKAEKYVLLEYFIIAHGKLTDQLIDVLSERASKGVKIRILYDDVGSRGKVNLRLLKKLAKIPNCQVNNYSPISLSPLVNNRDHRKIAVIDGKIAYCGGDNLADEYIHEKVKYGFWRDNCGKYEGSVAHTFELAFAENWYVACKKNLDVVDEPNTISPHNDGGYLMAFTDGPLAHGTPTYDLFLSMINSAQKYVLISTPYFVCNEDIIKALALKAKSGVKVCILMPAIPDKKAVFYMGRAKYRDILLAGGEIYEYTPGFNHAKNVIVDGQYAYIGTSNFDYRSLFLHYECGVLALHDEQINKMREDFDYAVSLSRKITYEQWKKRPLSQKFIAYFLNIFAPLF